MGVLALREQIPTWGSVFRPEGRLEYIWHDPYWYVHLFLLYIFAMYIFDLTLFSRCTNFPSVHFCTKFSVPFFHGHFCSVLIVPATILIDLQMKDFIKQILSKVNFSWGLFKTFGPPCTQKFHFLNKIYTLSLLISNRFSSSKVKN